MTREGLYEICVAPFVFMENEVKDLYGVYDQKKKKTMNFIIMAS